MSNHDFSWTVPVMRVGYAGRGLVYIVVAGFSLYAIWRGGQAQGTSSALRELETTSLGGIVLFLIFVGMLAYAVWRLIDSVYDLEEYGRDAKGTIARVGMIVTGIIHLAIGILALTLLFSGNSGGGSSIESGVAAVMRWPGGRWIVALGGLITIGAGAYYFAKAWSEEYRNHVLANRFTADWNWLLKAGVAAHGLVILIVGALFFFAAWRANPDRAGGVGEAFSWLTHQPYGQVLVGAVCLGLLSFALFCFVNAAYRYVPKASGADVETLAARLSRGVLQREGGHN